MISLILFILGVTLVWWFVRQPGQVFFNFGEKLNDYPYLKPITCVYCFCWWFGVIVGVIVWHTQYFTPFAAFMLPFQNFAVSAILINYFTNRF